MHVRQAVPKDAERVFALLEKLYAETAYLLYEPGEVKTTIEAYAKRMTDGLEKKTWMMYLAEIDADMVGVIFGGRGPALRTSHSFQFGIGVLESHWGKGIGAALLAAIEQWALAVGIHRLELTVHTTNVRAMRLYKRLGFEREGCKRHAQKVNGKYVDEYIMSKLLGRSDT